MLNVDEPSAAPTLCDFGAGTVVYAAMRAGEEARLVANGAGWRVQQQVGPGSLASSALADPSALLSILLCRLIL